MLVVVGSMNLLFTKGTSTPLGVLGAAILDFSAPEQPIGCESRRNLVIANHDGQNEHNRNNNKVTKKGSKIWREILYE